MTAPFAACLAALLSCGQAWAAVALATRFIEHTVDGLEPGKSHPLHDLAPSYALRNAGDAAVDVLLSAERPGASPPYEPIPDPSWVRFAPGKLRIAPGETASSEIAIDLPDDPSIFGRRFEVVLLARTAGTGAVSAGVRSRLRFSVRPGPKALPRSAEALHCALEPDDLVLKAAKSGRSFGIRRREKARWRVVNRGAQPLRLAARAVPWPAEGPRLPAGYEPARGLGRVRFDPKRLHIGAGEAKDLEMSFAAPAGSRGSRTAFLVLMETSGGQAACSEGRVFVEFE